MNPPPIRYPLPTLLALILLGLVAWQGAGLARSGWEAVASRWQRVVEGPPVPSSKEPQVVAGPILRRVLLLDADTATSDRPDGPTAETIRFRGFFDVYDVWPLQGVPTHYRIGNRRPIGWVAAAKVLPWNTRLVARAEGGKLTIADQPGDAAGSRVSAGPTPLPILEWSGGSLKVAAWEDGGSWHEVARSGWVAQGDLAECGVLLSREELLLLLDRMFDLESPEDRESLRARALIGRLSESRTLGKDEVAAVRNALPPFAFEIGSDSPAERANRLARLNENWEPVASWGGLEFAMVPIQDLP